MKKIKDRKKLAEPQEAKAAIQAAQTIMAERIPWTTFRHEIVDSAVDGTILWSAMLPWRLAIDFQGIDDNDRFLIRVHSCPRGDDQFRLSEFYRVQRGRPRSDYPGGLIVNETPIGPEMILVVEPTIKGPWLSRLTFAQTGGTPRILAYATI